MSRVKVEQVEKESFIIELGNKTLFHVLRNLLRSDMILMTARLTTDRGELTIHDFKIPVEELLNQRCRLFLGNLFWGYLTVLK